MEHKANLDEEGGESRRTGHGLFQGMSFWLSQNVPQRSRFKEIIQQNGGIVKVLEKDAEIQLVDHARKNLPANTFSYQFVETSVRNGKLENLEAYRAGPSAARPVGATHIPSRGHRLPYTMQEDQILWDWMQPYENDKSAPISGNKIYQDLAEKYPRHTYQSWRDRYLKRLRGHSRPGGPAEPTKALPLSDEPRSRSPHTPTPRSNATTLGADPELHRPQDKKRKRSPEPSKSSERESRNGNRQHTTTGTQNSLEASVPPTSITQAVDGSAQSPPNAKKAKNIENSATENSAPENTKSQEAIDALFLELPFFPSISEPEHDQEVPGQGIDAWIDDYLRMGKGVNEDQIIEALRCTSMDPELADKVLLSLIAGEGIPNDMRGVWTSEDDKCVEAQDSRDIERVLKKHGSDLFNSRWEYLNMAREAGLEKNYG
ncbi:hypothetical protein ARAM_004543 [Aspergillus rambellii]|uniref:DNA-binding protein RAP1 n=1 Tax=Aspergillus rambellii TaxID=308745 RepID=A0A0F8U7W2_9EURO|nr:hypothetical protein ARAM_004543 [Aspergillus rambellii]